MTGRGGDAAVARRWLGARLGRSIAPTLSPSSDPLPAARRFGWWSLLAWLTLGLVLEAMHGFKVGWYLDVGHETRRLMLTLAHVHGTLLALINLAFAATMRPTDSSRRQLGWAGACLRWSGVLMPAGFLGGGLQTFGDDPGFAIALVPIGGLLLLTGVLLAARALEHGTPPPEAP